MTRKKQILAIALVVILLIILGVGFNIWRRLSQQSQRGTVSGKNTIGQILGGSLSGEPVPLFTHFVTCDGVSDATAAIQQALDTYKIAYIPAGKKCLLFAASGGLVLHDGDRLYGDVAYNSDQPNISSRIIAVGKFPSSVIRSDKRDSGDPNSFVSVEVDHLVISNPTDVGPVPIIDMTGMRNSSFHDLAVYGHHEVGGQMIDFNCSDISPAGQPSSCIGNNIYNSAIGGDTFLKIVSVYGNAHTLLVSNIHGGINHMIDTTGSTNYNMGLTLERTYFESKIAPTVNDPNSAVFVGNRPANSFYDIAGCEGCTNADPVKAAVYYVSSTGQVFNDLSGLAVRSAAYICGNQNFADCQANSQGLDFSQRGVLDIAGGGLGIASGQSMSFQNSGNTSSQLNLSGTNFSTLPAVSNGSELYCGDCKSSAENIKPGSVCVGGGKGSITFRINDQWLCY